MKQHKLVLQGHLNHYGFLFGGELLRWIDETGYIAVNLEFPGHEFVTIGLNQVVFHKSIVSGSILTFDTALVKKGNTSATFNIDVYANTTPDIRLFSTEITFVSIDKDGNKTPIRETI
jgi:acyl-CoA hydrolase